MVPPGAWLKPQTPTAATEARTSSPLLVTLLGNLDPEQRIEILELGRPTPENLHYFSTLRCRLHYPGGAEELLDLPTEVEPADAGLAEWFPLDPALRLRVILAWDLLNYLAPVVIERLFAHLAPAIDRHTRVHAYVFPRLTMPASPGEYRLLGEGEVHVRGGGGTQIQCPAFRQPDLERLMPMLAVQRSMLLMNGNQEYLLQGRVSS